MQLKGRFTCYNYDEEGHIARSYKKPKGQSLMQSQGYTVKRVTQEIQPCIFMGDKTNSMLEEKKDGMKALQREVTQMEQRHKTLLKKASTYI